jgi:ribosomal protein S27AE
MAEREPIIVTAADVPNVGLSGPLRDLYVTSALASCAAELRTRQCPDCGTSVVVDEEPDRVVAHMNCPPTCPAAAGVTPTTEKS